MVQVVVPLVAVALALGLGALALGGPAPVVVVGTPALPATGAYAGRVELTFTLSGAQRDRDAVLEVRDLTVGTQLRRDLGAAPARVLLDRPGEHVLEWEVVRAGASTRGSLVLHVA